MGVLDKIAFWKKKDNFDLGKDFGADLGLGPDPGLGPNPGLGQDPGLGPGMPTAQDPAMPRGMQPGMDPNMNLGMPEDTGFGNLGQQPPTQPPGKPVPMQQPFGAPIQPPQPTERDFKNEKFEVVSAKLDSIRYTLDSINQRLANLERVAYGEHDKKRGW